MTTDHHHRSSRRRKTSNSPRALPVLPAVILGLALCRGVLASDPDGNGPHDEAPHGFLTGWGLVIAFFLLFLVTLLFLRKSYLPFSKSLDPTPGGLERTEEFRRYAYWLTQLRWLAVVVVVALSVLATQILRILSEELFLALMGLSLCLLVGNIVFLRLARTTANPGWLVKFQILFDLVILTLLLQFSGGIENPLYAIYIFHVVIAAIIFTGTGSYVVTTVAVVLLAALSLGEYNGVLPHYAIHLTPHTHRESLGHPAHDIAFVLGRLLPFAGVLFCLTYLTQIVAAHLHRRERQLAGQLREHKLMEAQLVQAGKMAAIGELAGNVAHEINNPVAIIGGKVKLLLDRFGTDDLPPEVLKDLKKIDRHTERIIRITSGLLAFSRPSLGKKEPLDLNDVVRATLLLVDHHLLDRKIRVESDLATDLPPVLGNRNELEQVFLNIMTNALDAMPEGGTLGIRTEEAVTSRENETAPATLVTISDTGTGIAEEKLRRIFEPFFTSKPEGKGTGLGLSISQGLIRSHGGEISVRSSPGKGSSFSILLPVTSGEKIDSELTHGSIEGSHTG